MYEHDYFMFFFLRYGDHRDLHVLTHSFPTRRSSDLTSWQTRARNTGIRPLRISTFCILMASPWPGSIYAAIPIIGTTGCAVAAGQRPPSAGACACWKIPAWMHATRTRFGFPITIVWRSEERRVGKGVVSTCRFRGAPYH